MGESAAAGARRAAHEIGVGCRTDTDREEARPAQPVMDGGKQRVLIAYGAVRQEDHLAHAGGVLRRGIGQGGLHGGQHLGAAIGVEAANKAPRPVEIVPACVDRRGKDLLHRIVETDDVEPVAGLHPVECAQQGLLGLAHGSAGHRS